MMDIFLDIETRPCDDPDLIAEITSKVKAPGTMKKYDTIQKWEQEERPQAIANAIATTSLNGAYGRVCAIGWAIDDADPSVLVTEDERELLLAFCSEVGRVLEPMDGNPPMPTWVGHNIAGFDLPFLRKRFVVHGIAPPLALRTAMTSRSWDARIADTMLMWDTDRDKRVGLDLLCRVLSIPSPKAEGIDGSKVAEMFAAGEYQRIGEYCAQDVIATRRCYRALTWS